MRFLILRLGGDNRSVFGHFHGAVEADALAVGEFDFTGRSSEQGVVVTLLNIFARVNTGAALANDDHAGFDSLSVMNFYS